jgi:hypothetical protein
MEGRMTTHDTQMGPRLGEGENPSRLADRIESHIESRLCGRILQLHVVCTCELVVLRGRSRTYYAKQLAQEAALDLADGPPRLDNQIVVF